MYVIILMKKCNKTVSPKGFVLFLKIQGRKDLSECGVVVNAKWVETLINSRYVGAKFITNELFLLCVPFALVTYLLFFMGTLLTRIRVPV
jgi:hypothetical protein